MIIITIELIIYHLYLFQKSVVESVESVVESVESVVESVVVLGDVLPVVPVVLPVVPVVLPVVPVVLPVVPVVLPVVPVVLPVVPEVIAFAACAAVLAFAQVTPVVSIGSNAQIVDSIVPILNGLLQHLAINTGS